MCRSGWVHKNERNFIVSSFYVFINWMYLFYFVHLFSFLLLFFLWSSKYSTVPVLELSGWDCSDMIHQHFKNSFHWPGAVEFNQRQNLIFAWTWVNQSEKSFDTLVIWGIVTNFQLFILSFSLTFKFIFISLDGERIVKYIPFRNVPKTTNNPWCRAFLDSGVIFFFFIYFRQVHMHNVTACPLFNFS